MESAMLNAEVEKQLANLQSEDVTAQSRALAMITVLFSRCENDSQVSAVAAAVPSLYSCLESPDQLVQANACAALTAAAALDDQLAASVAEHSTKQLVALLQQCCSGDRADLQLNVVSALGQLARDQQLTAQALMEPAVLPCLLCLVAPQQPAKLQEAVADCLCALASQDWAKQGLRAAGAVTAASGLLNVQQLEVSVRCLMVLGMLLPSSTDAQQQLADNAPALLQLLALLKQSEDADCKVIARDVLGLLMRDEALRGKRYILQQPTLTALLRMKTFSAAPAAALLLLALALLACSAHAQDSQHWKPNRPPRACVAKDDRAVRLITLANGQTFCLRMPRYLKNPELDVLGKKKFARTFDDTCGLYGIVFSPFVPAGGGPPPHIHYADHEWFLPGQDGDVVRVHAQAASTGPYQTYQPGQIPAVNMPAIKVGGVEVAYGGIGYSPPNTPHTWKASTDLHNFMAIWEFAWGMKPAVNIPESETNATVVMQLTGMWGLPTDNTAAMFGGPQFVQERLRLFLVG
ncbi:hypothetical protein OEZ86_001828 [Tetradesmus obliquus]|nr:hypothetical protein OEZ86_001828 [Tetradesmus obliquus]